MNFTKLSWFETIFHSLKVNIQTANSSERLLNENNVLIENDIITRYQNLNATVSHEDFTYIRMSTRFSPLLGGAKKII